MPQVVKSIMAHKHFKLGVVLVLLLSFFDVGLKLLIAIFAGRAVENINDIRQFFLAIAVVLISIGLGIFRTNIHNIVVIKTASKIFKPLHLEVFGSLLKNDPTAEDVARAQDRMHKLRDISLACGGYYIRLAFHVIFAVITGLILSWRLSVVYLVVCIMLYILFDVAGKFILRNEDNKFVPFVLSNISVIKMFHMEREVDSRFSQRDKHLTHFKLRKSVKIGMYGLKFFFIVIQSLALFGAWYMFYGWAGPGMVVSFMVVAGFITRAVWEYQSAVFYLKVAKGICRNLDEDVNHV